jgi:hypothetical protein
MVTGSFLNFLVILPFVECPLCVMFHPISRLFSYIAGTPSEPSAKADGEDNGSCSALPVPSSEHAYVPNIEQVASYFSQRMGTNVTTNEVESIITNLQTSHKKFNESTLPLPFSPSDTASPVASPSKKLARNPNGIYRWERGGSAKAARQRNRFVTPASGVSPSKTARPTTEESADSPGQDNKRRKVAASFAGQCPRKNGKTSPLPPSRLRKTTAPINPSPLRQAWSDVSSTSSHEDNTTKPTKAAELIKETAALPNKPDLSNPYQTASPVRKVGPPRRATKRERKKFRPFLC